MWLVVKFLDKEQPGKWKGRLSTRILSACRGWQPLNSGGCPSSAVQSTWCHYMVSTFKVKSRQCTLYGVCLKVSSGVPIAGVCLSRSALCLGKEVFAQCPLVSMVAQSPNSCARGFRWGVARHKRLRRLANACCSGPWAAIGLLLPGGL